jgi:hypothetical protein
MFVQHSSGFFYLPTHEELLEQYMLHREFCECGQSVPESAIHDEERYSNAMKIFEKKQ